MPAYANQILVRFDGGDRPLTYAATANTLGGRFVTLNGATAGYPGLTNTSANSLTAAHSTAAARTSGVARWDAANGELGEIVRPGSICQVYASNTIGAGAEVEVGANGQSAVLASGVPVARAITAGTSGALHYVLIY